MFRTWKSQVTDRLGMFHEWELDRMMRRHRTRMDTMIREGKLPEMEENTNPYVEEECGGLPMNTEGTGNIRTRRNDFQDKSKNGGSTLPGNSQVEPKGKGKIYLLWLMDNLKNMEPSIGKELCEDGLYKYSYWRPTCPNGNKLFMDWRDEDGASVKNMEDSRRKLKQDAIHARLEEMSSEDAITALLRGDLQASSKVPKKMLRLFISCTFCDTKAERNFLMRDTYPKIREICDQNGIAFMAVDLGWGQADASVFDKGFSRICLEEMQRCREQTIEGVPCVVHILTNKYGTPGLPEYIEKYEHEYILSSIEDEDARETVERWYVLDENAMPPAYRLRRFVPNEPLIVSPDKHERKLMSARWSSTESHLFHIMKDAVDQSYGFKQERKDKWEISPFGCQVSLMFDNESTVSSRTLCIIRNIPQLSPLKVADNHSASQKIISLYVDVNRKEHSRDMKLKKRLDGLKRRFKSMKVKCKKYSINWSPFGINESTHLDYLNHLTASVLKEMKSRLLSASDREDYPEDLVVDIASQARYCLSKADMFFGRDTLVHKIIHYIADDSNSPLIVHGGRGCGKTSLMAATITQLSEISEERDDINPVIITRFCTLQKKLTTSDFLRSVSQQLRITCSTKKSYEIMLQAEKCLDLENLGGIFKNLLSKASVEEPLFFFFDSIDDLRNGSPKTWVPTELPRHVKMVVSVQDRNKELVTDLMQASQTLHILPLDKVQTHDVLVGKFGSIHRTLQPNQLDQIVIASIDGSGQCSNMYRLQLLFERSCHWSSTEKLTAFSNDQAEMLLKFLEKLELDHGKTLVAHVLSLLHLSRRGLSEPHLLDILSADDEVLQSVLLVNPPPTKRFPHSIFSKLRHDLGDHLVDSSTNGHNVLTIADRQMAEAIVKRYIGHEDYLKEKYYSLIANYFTCEMHDRYPGRSLSPQPLYAANPRNGCVYFNHAKLCELPTASILGSNPSCISYSLCNLTFIAAKCAAGLMDDLLEDYALAESVLIENAELNSFWSFVKTHGQDVTQYPELTLEKALEWCEGSAVYAQAKSMLETRINVAPWVRYAPPRTGLSRVTSAGMGSYFDTMSDITSVMGGAQVHTAT